MSGRVAPVLDPTSRPWRRTHRLIKNDVIRIREVLASRHWNSPGSQFAGCVLVPIAFGLYSVLLGQDRNWDLLNYHLYNGFAAWVGKGEIDLAPAGMQTYFNPTLDVFYYALFTALPPAAVGFLLGLLHGLNFILVLAIARRVLPDLPDQDRRRLPLLLAGAGVLTANFLSCLGNTMGDNLTALFCLGGLLATLIHVEREYERRSDPSRNTVLPLWAGGMLMGLGTGLKLTNGIYPLALCATLLLLPGMAQADSSKGPGMRARLATSLGFGIAVLIGFAIAGGHWHLQMWETWGNPFFPQFSSLFPNPVVPTVSVVDTYFLPKSLTEYLLWPLLFSLDSSRVGQMPVRQIIWAVAYLVLLGWVAGTVVRRLRGTGGGPRGTGGSTDGAASGPRSIGSATDATGGAADGSSTASYRWPRTASALVIFVCLGYLLWLLLFSIYRYLVVLELLLPLFIVIVMRGLLSYRSARKASLGLIALCTVVVVAGGAATWGHEGWASPAFRADLPALEHPERTTVLLPVPDPPLAWMAALFSPSVAFAQLEPIFPRTEVYPRRVQALIRERAGPLFVLFDARHNSRIEQVERLQRVASLLHLDRSPAACDRLGRLIERFRLRTVVEQAASSPAKRPCRLALRPQDQRDLLAENRARGVEIAAVLTRHGLRLDVDRCITRQAFIGDGERPFQWCPVDAHP